jgi:hypothetical protein
MRPAEKGTPAGAATPGPAQSTGQCAVILPPSRYQEKRYATLAAQAALQGLELRRLHDGSFVVVRWGLTRHLQTVDAVAQFLGDAT